MTTTYKAKGWHKIIDRSLITVQNFYEISFKAKSSSLSYFAAVPTGNPAPTSSDDAVYLYEPKSIDTKIFYTYDTDVWIYIASQNESYTLLDSTIAHATIPAPIDCIKFSTYNDAHFLLGGGGGVPIDASDVETTDGSNVQTHLDSLATNKLDTSGVIGILEGTGSATASKIVLTDQDGSGTAALAINNRGLMLQDETTAESTFVETAGLPIFYKQEVILNAGQWTAQGASADGNNERGVVFDATLADVGDYVIFRDIVKGGVSNFLRQRFDVVPVLNTGGDTSFVYNTIFSGGNYGGGTFGLVFYKQSSNGEVYPWTTYTTNAETPQGLGISHNISGATPTCRAITGAGYPLDIKIEVDATKEIYMYYNVRQEVIDAGIVTGAAGYRYLAKTNGTLENGYIYLPMMSLWEYANNLGTNDLLFHDTSNIQLYKLLTQSHYLVYDISAADLANVTEIDSSTVTASGTSRTVTLVSHPSTYTFDGTEWKLYSLSYEEMLTIKKSKVFTTYPVTTEEEVIARGNALRSIQQKKLDVCKRVAEYIVAFEDTLAVTADVDLQKVIVLLLQGYLVSVIEKIISLPISGIVTVTAKDAVLTLLRESYYKFPSEQTMIEF